MNNEMHSQVPVPPVPRVMYCMHIYISARTIRTDPSVQYGFFFKLCNYVIKN